eukprot:scaffold1483_cov379-Prasinococcus_capsulatus_cf.AAC.1
MRPAFQCEHPALPCRRRCKSCQQFVSKYYELSKHVIEAGEMLDKVVLAKIDVDSSAALTKRFQVERTPTILLFVPSAGKHIQYTGSRDAVSLYEFIASALDGSLVLPETDVEASTKTSEVSKEADTGAGRKRRKRPPLDDDDDFGPDDDKDEL